MNEHPHVMTSDMCSALFAASFAKWQRRYNKYPIAAPSAAQNVLPMSLARTQRMLQTVKRDTAWQHTSACVERMLRRCGHPEHADLFPDDALPPKDAHELRTGHGLGRKATTEISSTDVLSWVDSDIDFDALTWTTQVTVWSTFTEVPSATAQRFFDLAKPANWHKARGVFKQSAPGRWDPASGTFLRANGDLGAQYQIFEEAEWSWSPEMSGGFMNILEISERERTAKSFSKFGESVLRKLFDDNAKTARAMRPLTSALLRQHESTPGQWIDYSYGLHRSLRSRIIGGWRSGGLSKDDGRYQAAWYPAKGRDVGLLCIEITKELAFSRQVDVFDDYSSLLNLMAPALGSLLMEQLAHDGIHAFIRGADTKSNTTKVA